MLPERKRKRIIEKQIAKLEALGHTVIEEPQFFKDNDELLLISYDTVSKLVKTVLVKDLIPTTKLRFLLAQTYVTLAHEGSLGKLPEKEREEALYKLTLKEIINPRHFRYVLNWIDSKNTSEYGIFTAEARPYLQKIAEKLFISPQSAFYYYLRMKDAWLHD